MLNLVQEVFDKQVSSTWASDINDWCKMVALYRQYAQGEHRAKMTSEMRRLLRVADSRTEQFNANYCDMVIQTMADRLTVDSITAVDERVSAWGEDVLEANRFDALQMDVHEATLRDGETFVMVGYDNRTEQVQFTHELAFNGISGVIPVYDRAGQVMIAAVKIWYEGEVKRVNIYYADRVVRYMVGVSQQDNEVIESLDLLSFDEWVDVSGQGLGVPLIHFRNRLNTNAHGMSELNDIIPLQDSLNRTLVSMVMTSELSAFQIRIARGFQPPADVTPGMWVVIGAEGLSNDQVADASVLQQGEIVPFISQAQFLREEIATISRTPLPSQMGGDSSSGEALKQRETGLLSKVRRFQIKSGNAWEDMMALAGRVQTRYGLMAIGAMRWYCKWKDAQIRNERDIIANAKEVRDDVGEREFLRLVAPVFGWDNEKIDSLLAEKTVERSNRLNSLMQTAPSFSEFGV